jgi:mannose-6-phosphate isomerase-like protein (cupin superfamily)
MTTTRRLFGGGACVLAAVAVAAVAAAQQPAGGTQPPSPPLTVSTLFDHDTVAGCRASASYVRTTEYIVSCSNRTGPGVVEVHLKETDVLYIVDGAATFVTGGTAQNLKADDPLQPRGTGIEGGETHHLVKGDVIVVPPGQPHWFKEVPASVSYFVVKVVKP